MALTPEEESKAWGKIARFLEPNPGNMRKLLFNVMKFIRNNVWIRFRQQRAASGEKWDANKKSTIDAKGHSIVGIGKTHELVRAIDSQEAKFDSTGATLGDDLPEHALFFSIQTKHKWGIIPARPIMEISDEDEDRALALLENEVFRILETTI